MSVTLRRVIPQNFNPEGYSEFNNVDYVLSHQGSSLELGSVRIQAKLEIQNNNTPLYTDANSPLDINIDNYVGAHTFVDGIQTEFQNKGVIESCLNLPRFVKMKVSATNLQDNLNEAKHTCELRAGNSMLQNSILKGSIPREQLGTPVYKNPDFSFKPEIALNSRSGMLPYSRTGDIRITLNLNTIASAIHGINTVSAAGASTVEYVLKDLEVTYRTRPETGEEPPLQLDSKMSIKQSIQSSYANVSAQVPAVCNSVSCSFIPSNQINSQVYNNTDLYKVINLKELQFSFNDSTNKGVSFLIRDDVESQGRYIESFMDVDNNSVSRNNINNNVSYGLGLRFGNDAIDLRNQKFNIQLQSNISSANPFTMFLYFHSLISV